MSPSNQPSELLLDDAKSIDFLAVTKSLLAKVFVANTDGDVLFVNDRWVEYTGRSIAHSRGSAWQDAVDERDRIRAVGLWNYTREVGRIAEFEMRLVESSTKESRWHVCRINPIRDTDGNVLQWCAFIADVHDQKLDHAGLEQHLGEQSRELALISARLSVVTEALTDFVQNQNVSMASRRLLAGAIRLTDSDTGFIGAVIDSHPDHQVVRVFANDGFVWNESDVVPQIQDPDRSPEANDFVDLKSANIFFTDAIQTAKPILLNDVDRSHIRLIRIGAAGDSCSFLGVPILKGSAVVGLIALGRHKRSYSEQDAEKIEGLTHAGSVLYDAYLKMEEHSRSEKARIEASEELHAANEQLAREREFSQLGEVIPQMVWTSAPDGSLDYHNQRWHQYTGLSETETRQNGWAPVIHPDDRVKSEQIWHQCVKTGEPYEIEFRILRASDQTYRWHLGRALPIRDATNEIVKWFGTCTDIHDQILAQEEAVELSLRLQKSESELRQLAEAVPEVVWTSGRYGEIEYFNQRWYEYTGLTIEDSIGWGWQQALHPDERIAHEKVWKNAFSTGTCIQMEQRLRNEHGRYRWFLARAVPFRDEKGDVIKWFGTLTDIEDQKHNSELLEQGVLERTNQLKSLAERHEEATMELQTLAYTISHELQAPLKTIISDLGLLAVRYKGRLGLDADEFIGNCVDAAHKTQRMVDDLWIYARLDRPNSVIKAVDINEMVERSRITLKEQLEQKQAVITCDSLPTINGNSDQLQYLLTQLIQNSVTFNTDPQPVVHISSLKKDNCWIISVKDNGIGFEMVDAIHIFKMFVRLANQYPGTGMGLAICKKIVSVHGGNIWAESQPHQGSTFYVSLPSGS